VRTRYYGCVWMWGQTVVADLLIGVKATRVRVGGPATTDAAEPVVADLPIGTMATEVRVGGPATTDAV